VSDKAWLREAKKHVEEGDEEVSWEGVPLGVRWLPVRRIDPFKILLS
jgi:hypothetical protein